MMLLISVMTSSVASAAMICGFNDAAGKLASVTGACRSSAQSGEYNAQQTTYFFDKGITFNCPNQVCALRQGTELCAAVAKIDGQVGNYACMESSDCGSVVLSNGQVGGGLCTGSQVCCVAKASAAASSSSGGSGNSSPKSIEVPDPLNGVTIPGLIGNIIRTFAGIAGSIALVIFVWGGFSYILSGGDPGKVKNATAMLRNGAIGIILIFGAYFFTATIMNLILVQNT